VEKIDLICFFFKKKFIIDFFHLLFFKKNPNIFVAIRFVALAEEVGRPRRCLLTLSAAPATCPSPPPLSPLGFVYADYFTSSQRATLEEDQCCKDEYSADDYLLIGRRILLLEGLLLLSTVEKYDKKW